jgi:site-specific DNA-methyltransferase (adenine-specific)
MYIKLMFGDCLERMKEIPERSIDMVLCDLPYGITNNKWDCPLPLDILFLLYRKLLKNNGIICLTAGQPFTSELVNKNLNLFKHEWIWLKNRGSNFLNIKREPFKQHESILIFCRTSNYTYNPQMEKRNDNSKHAIGKKRISGRQSNNYGKYNSVEYCLSEKRFPTSYQKFDVVSRGPHATQKPVLLLEYLIKTYTNENETILDNCMGSGSTGIACINTNRNFIGIEKDENYFIIANNRINKKTNENITFESDINNVLKEKERYAEFVDGLFKE